MTRAIAANRNAAVRRPERRARPTPSAATRPAISPAPAPAPGESEALVVAQERPKARPRAARGRRRARAGSPSCTSSRPDTSGNCQREIGKLVAVARADRSEAAEEVMAHGAQVVPRLGEDHAPSEAARQLAPAGLGLDLEPRRRVVAEPGPHVPVDGRALEPGPVADRLSWAEHPLLARHREFRAVGEGRDPPVEEVPARVGDRVVAVAVWNQVAYAATGRAKAHTSAAAAGQCGDRSPEPAAARIPEQAEDRRQGGRDDEESVGAGQGDAGEQRAGDARPRRSRAGGSTAAPRTRRRAETRTGSR